MDRLSQEENLALQRRLKTLETQMHNVRELLASRYGASSHVVHISTAADELKRLLRLLDSEVLPRHEQNSEPPRETFGVRSQSLPS